MLPSYQLTRQIRNLEVCLCLFLDIKDANYYVIQSLMIITSFDELKLEVAILAEEFGYRTINQAREDFRRLVLTRMEKEAKEIKLDLKPFYVEEASIYNAVVSTDHDGSFNPIRLHRRAHSLSSQGPAAC